MSDKILPLALVGGAGLIWGSFLNVCIARMPTGISVVTGRSHCPHCKEIIPWHLNVPVLSFLFLRGHCSACKKRISLQYPLVELSTAALFTLLLLKFELGPQWLAYAVFVSGLIVLTGIDLEHRIIPDELSLGGIPVGFLAALWTGDIPWWASALGVLLGGGFFYAVAWVYEKATGREGLGGGDIKLLGAIGAWLGYSAVLPVIILSSTFGSVTGLLYMILAKKDLKLAIPFGPFLAIAAFLYLMLREYLAPLFYSV